MPGLSSSGFAIRTQPELQALLEAAVDAATPGINLRAGPIQQIIGVLSEQLAIAWEAAQEAYAAQYPDGAEGLALDQLAALTGTTRRPATSSSVVLTLNLNPGVTVPAGSIVAVTGQPDDQYRTTEDATNSGGSPDDIDVPAESVATGPVPGAAGTIETIVTPVSGWNSVTNAANAEPGREVAGDPELRTQRVVELAGAGQGSYAAIRAAVADIDEVIEVQVFGNETLTTDGDGRPGKSFEAVIWDGAIPAADDDEIAQAIWNMKPAGIIAHGVGDSGTAVDETGAERTVAFTRVDALRVYVAATVILEDGAGSEWADQGAAAIVARGAEYTPGDDAYASHLIAALQAVPGIAAVVTMKLEAGDPTPDDASVAVNYDEIATIALADVAVTEAP